MREFFVRFLVRTDCHLCEDAEAAVRRAAALTRSRIVEVDVDSDPELAVDWGLRIPVVLDPAGRVLGEGDIAFWPLLKALIETRLRRRT